MKRLMIITILIGLMVFVYGQKPVNYDDQIKAMYKNTVELIAVADLEIEMGKNPDLVLLDTREMVEYNVSHIDGSKCIGYNNFSIKSLNDIPKDTEIVVYCSLGVRSELIGEKLQEAGYKNVKNLYGGIFEWMYHDQIVVNKKGKATDKIHTYDENWSQWLLKGKKVY
ncbi:MAG: rhodanese-like domain-containing protein [Bacteroidales bacterium]|nr:rhodanese-like domain-containing protein [Bacteroidales bacterium]